MWLHIGQSALYGDISRYAQRFNLLELRAEPGRLPKTATLNRWLASVPAGFRFSVMLPRAVGSLVPGEAHEAALGYALERARALEAAWLVLQTPASVMPGARSPRRLAELVERLAGSWRIAWEPRGLWEDDEAEQLAKSLGVHLVRDLTRCEPPAAQVLYTRLLALGEAAELRGAAIEALAERLVGSSEAWVVVEGRGAGRAARMLRELNGDEAEDGEGRDEAGDGGYVAWNGAADGTRGDEPTDPDDPD